MMQGGVLGGAVLETQTVSAVNAETEGTTSPLNKSYTCKVSEMWFLKQYVVTCCICVSDFFNAALCNPSNLCFQT